MCVNLASKMNLSKYSFLVIIIQTDGIHLVGHYFVKMLAYKIICNNIMMQNLIIHMQKRPE